MKFYFLRGSIDFDKLKLHHALMMYMLKRIISVKTVKTEDEKALLENYGKKIIGAESFTTIGPHWNDELWCNQKPAFDHEICAGLQ